MGGIKKGILLLALGHENYFRMAINLAASLKVNNPTIKIAIINDGTRAIDSALFDHSVVVQAEGLLHAYKTQLYGLSPFNQTLYLDVDMIALPGTDFIGLIDSLEGISFTIMNTRAEQCIWADTKDVRALADNDTDPMYIFYSELMYFEKCKDAKALFSEAKKQMSAVIKNRLFAGGMADELAFIIASLRLRIKPHQDNWLPVFWHFREKKKSTLQPYQLKEKYVAYSIGGNMLPAYIKANYNNLVTYYISKIKITRPYKAVDKRNFLPSRAKI